MSALVWLRGDLRITDNRALHAAVSAHETVAAVFHDTPEQWALHGDAAVKIDFIRRNVAMLVLFVGGGIFLMVRYSVPPSILSAPSVGYLLPVRRHEEL